jgi:hypothetical protein
MTGREAMGLYAIRRELSELNAALDGPAGACLMWRNGADETGIGERWAEVVCSDAYNLEAVVSLPGDGKPFPSRAYAEALACSQVLEEP